MTFNLHNFTGEVTAGIISSERGRSSTLIISSPSFPELLWRLSSPASKGVVKELAPENRSSEATHGLTNPSCLEERRRVCGERDRRYSTERNALEKRIQALSAAVNSNVDRWFLLSQSNNKLSSANIYPQNRTMVVCPQIAVLGCVSNTLKKGGRI
jgi:hypothetical protein